MFSPVQARLTPHSAPFGGVACRSIVQGKIAAHQCETPRFRRRATLWRPATTSHLSVVPAKAGTHNYRCLLQAELLPERGAIWTLVVMDPGPRSLCSLVRDDVDEIPDSNFVQQKNPRSAARARVVHLAPPSERQRAQ